MGRAGGGSSGGGHDSGFSGGGHQVGESSGSRAGSGLGMGGGHSGSFYHGNFHMGPLNGMDPRSRRKWQNFFRVTAICIVVLFICYKGFFGDEAGSSVSASTTEREALTGIAAYDYDCVVDELGWISSTSQVAADLKYFYEETGVQPYIVLLAYDSSLTTDEEKAEYAENYYENNIDIENAFLYVYFAEEDTDNDVGYMYYVRGAQASAIMDSEAVNIFWEYVDAYWYSSLDTDEMFAKIFESTADNIMAHQTNKWDVLKVVLIIAGVVAVLIVVFLIIKEKHRRAKEKAKETQDILNTPLHKINDEAEDLIDKYKT